jgi:hypothetical protein
VEPDLIYANTPTTLYTVDLAGRDVRPVGDFAGEAFGERITDIAVDDLGVLYAVSTSQLYQCDAVTVECEALAAIEGANAAAFLSVPELSDVSMLYLATSFGEWIRVDVYAKPVTIEYLGTLWSETEGPAVSDGDIATVFDDTGVPVHVVSVDFDSGLNGRIRQVDPDTGFLGSMAGLGYQGTDDLWGLVQFQGVVYAFTPSSLIYSSIGVVDINEVSRPEWWGASADGASL